MTEGQEMAASVSGVEPTANAFQEDADPAGVFEYRMRPSPAPMHSCGDGQATPESCEYCGLMYRHPAGPPLGEEVTSRPPPDSASVRATQTETPPHTILPTLGFCPTTRKCRQVGAGPKTLLLT